MTEQKKKYGFLKIGRIEVENPVLLAPMEDVTDLPYRLICRKLGADIVYSEFIASEGIIRDAKRSKQKMLIDDRERPVALQIFGSNIDAMVKSAQIIEEIGVDFIDINYGCWVKNVVRNNAGAALLKEPDKMVLMTKAVVDAVKVPVTVKTRLGWDKSSIIIVELAKRLENTGIAALSIHCRTRIEAIKGEADWSWIPKIKANISIPVILNGDVKNHKDVKRAFEETGCDGVMIGRAAIGYPFIFREAKHFLDTGEELSPPDISDRIEICLEHLRNEIEFKGLHRGLIEFRKNYSGYLKGLRDSHQIRQKLVVTETYDEIVDILYNYKDYLLSIESSA
ncbi:MAG: tRNA dihydrouridine synthase DusB [Candidatus Kapabacteria bacterium]|nr:tRNA dihydrouridine synthase DusB [Candidatus Kapabacteria bacterium]